MTNLESRLKAEARRLGFTLVGIAPAAEADGFSRFEAWLDADYAGEMGYLHRHREARRHPRSVVEGVRSVLMLGLEYSECGMGNSECGMESRSSIPHSEFPIPHSGRVARYAQGLDYHRFIWDRENELADWLMRESPGCVAFGVSDTAPLLERDFARRAGLGWVGKNTMLINKHRGSFFFLGALLTDRELQPDSPHEESHCGTCTACLEACPTGAFPEPGVLDARRCISYLTIELRSPIPEELRPNVGDWLFGCDVCQDVCPWNRHAADGPTTFPHDPSLATLDPVELLSLSEPEFRRRFRGTSLFRTRRSGLLRNAAIVLGNIGDERVLPALEMAATDKDEVIREAACWAINRIRQRALRSSPNILSHHENISLE